MTHSDVLELKAGRKEHFGKVKELKESYAQPVKKEKGGWIRRKAKKDEVEEEKATKTSRKNSEITQITFQSTSHDTQLETRNKT